MSSDVKDLPKVEEMGLPEAAVLLRIPWWTAYAWATAGKLGPVRREGRRWILTRLGVRAYAKIRDKGSR